MKNEIDKVKPGRPKRTDKDNTTVPSAERSTMPGDKRKTYIVNTILSYKIDEIAYQERTSVKDVVNQAFSMHVAKYEKKKGKIVLPQK